jgi:hypothetical protein
LADTDFGDYLFANGVKRIADSETISLLWGFLDLIERVDHAAPIPISGVIADATLDHGQKLVLLAGNRLLMNGVDALCFRHRGTFFKLADKFQKMLSEGLETPSRLREPTDPSELQISKISLEACNRGCRHCSMAATPNLTNISPAVFDEWIRRFRPARTVSITDGEPFYSPTLPHIIRRLLSSDLERRVRIVTSGINLSSERELLAASAISSLPVGSRKRIELVLSVSDYPNHFVPGLVREEARRQVQLNTVKFAIEQSLDFYFVSFFPPERLFEEILFPVLHELAPGLDLTGAVVCSIQNRHKKEGAYGRWATSIGEIYGDLGKRSDSLPVSSCILNQGDPHQLSITTDGATPDCCTNASAFMVMANLKDGTAEMTRKATEFVARLRERDYEKQKRGIGRLTCIDCLGLAPRLRHQERCIRVIGPKNFDRVERMREAGLR